MLWKGEDCPFPGTVSSWYLGVGKRPYPTPRSRCPVVSILSALAGTSHVAEKSTGQEDGDQGWNPGSVPGSLVVL